MTTCLTCGQVIHDGRVTFDFDHRCVTGELGTVELSFMENEVLRYIHKFSPDTVTGMALDWHIFKSLAVDASKNIGIYVIRLRKKLAEVDERIELHCSSGTSGGRECTLYWLTW